MTALSSLLRSLKLRLSLVQLQVEWNGGAETKDEILGRIHQREEATIKRERALAYAFAHQVNIYKKKLLFPLFAAFYMKK